MEADKLISRTVFPEVPPKVEYGLTEKGRALLPILEQMIAFGETFQDDIKNKQ